MIGEKLLREAAQKQVMVSRGSKGETEGEGRHPVRARVIIQIEVGELLCCGVQADCGALVLCLATLQQW